MSFRPSGATSTHCATIGSRAPIWKELLAEDLAALRLRQALRSKKQKTTSRNLCLLVANFSREPSRWSAVAPYSSASRKAPRLSLHNLRRQLRRTAHIHRSSRRTD